MAPPGPPYNIPPTDEDVGPTRCVPSGQIYSENRSVEMVVTEDDTSIDAASLQETVPTDGSYMFHHLTVQDQHHSQVTHSSFATSFAPSHSVQQAMFERNTTARGTSSLDQSAQDFGTQPSTHGNSLQFYMWTQHRQMFGQVVVATDDNGSQYEIWDGVMNPGLAKEEERLRTYRRYPQEFPFSPQKAASAGLYWFEGTCLKCFACGGGLDYWDPGDDPLQEHARFYKWCPYVAAVLVERYIAGQG